MAELTLDLPRSATFRRIPPVPAASITETLCACAAASGTGIVTCAPACTLSCNGVSKIA